MTCIRRGFARAIGLFGLAVGVLLWVERTGRCAIGRRILQG